ncbi:hypothetical protein M472_21905 [Sphingobacterium paucimobilis HER1398]|uniref:Uncharacterized protein n=2 Tax=Sphingobacterium TaxID=28453 RepID=U2I1L7_9SPHI|nr:hypothetical protein M472_21905 [Sphingobacterium paucimobilis HER1398]
MKMIKTGLVALFLSTTGSTFGQTNNGTIDKGPLKVGPTSPHGATERETLLGLSGNASNANFTNQTKKQYEEANAVLFYNPNNPGSGLTLVASRQEDFTGITPAPTRAAQDFTHYRWTYMGQDNSVIKDGTTYNAELNATEGWLKEYLATNDNKLSVTGLTQGYHYFKVQGYIVPAGTTLNETCMQYSETFVVFVLPQLTVDAKRADGGKGVLQYCETEASDQDNVELQADIKYDGYTGSPTLESFELKYTWYSVKADARGNYSTIDATKVDLAGAEQRASNDVTSISNSFSPSIAEVGKYKFFVEVEYTVKERTYDGAETSNARKRTYALYRGWVGGTDQNSATEVFVTPAPGKPHITIEAVQD